MKEKSSKKILLKWMSIFILVLSSTVLLVPQKDGAIPSLIRQLATPLGLTEEQAVKIDSIISASQEQMARDREMFKGNEPALIEMAKKRRDMTEMHIRAVLDPGQLEKYPQVKEIIHLDDHVVSLMEILAMTYPQAYKTAEIMGMEEKQARLDRETYKISALALISAARTRREMADIHIMDCLNPQQQQKFYVFKQERESDTEFFELKEGLILDREQAVKVEQILSDFRKITKEDRKKRGERMSIRMPGMTGGGGGRGGGMGGGRGGMMGGGSGGPGMERGGPTSDNHMMQKMKEQEEKKTNAIMEILLPEQIQRYEQILEKKKQDMATTMKQMMRKRR